MQALDVKLNLPAIPRLRCAVTDDEVVEFYVTLLEKVFQAAAITNHGLSKYQNFCNACWKMKLCHVMTSETYCNSVNIVRERQLVFARFSSYL